MSLFEEEVELEEEDEELEEEELDEEVEEEVEPAELLELALTSWTTRLTIFSPTLPLASVAMILSI